jgi:uroporphyrinogen-III synthase
VRILYVGTDPSRYKHEGELVHYPVIRTVLRTSVDDVLGRDVARCTHWMFTSPNAVRHWFSMGAPGRIEKSFAVGPTTAAALAERGIKAMIAPIATQEGLIELLKTWDLEGALIGWPRSSKARTVLGDYLTKRGVSFLGIDLYEPVMQRLEPVPDLGEFDEIVFTSPSTVDAFLAIFGRIPWEKKIVPLGPVTADRLKDLFQILEKNQTINKEVSLKMQKMVGFRNIAVHDYQAIDPKILISIITHHLKDLEEFYDVVLRKFPR